MKNIAIVVALAATATMPTVQARTVNTIDTLVRGTSHIYDQADPDAYRVHEISWTSRQNETDRPASQIHEEMAFDPQSGSLFAMDSYIDGGVSALYAELDWKPLSQPDVELQKYELYDWSRTTEQLPYTFGRPVRFRLEYDLSQFGADSVTRIGLSASETGTLFYEEFYGNQQVTGSYVSNWIGGSPSYYLSAVTDWSGGWHTDLPDSGSVRPHRLINVSYQIGPAIPEPETYALMGGGLFSLWLLRRRKRGPARGQNRQRHGAPDLRN